MSVQELDWTRPEQYATLAPPYDFVLAADCVYHEELVQNFFDAVLAMVSLKTTGVASVSSCVSYTAQDSNQIRKYAVRR